MGNLTGGDWLVAANSCPLRARLRRGGVGTSDGFGWLRPTFFGAWSRAHALADGEVYMIRELPSPHSSGGVLSTPFRAPEQGASTPTPDMAPSGSVGAPVMFFRMAPSAGRDGETAGSGL